MNLSDVWHGLAQALGLPQALLPDTGERLFHLEGLDPGNAEDPVSALAVEAWVMREAISSLYELRITALTSRLLDTRQLLGRGVRLRTTLADGGSCYRSGTISRAHRQVVETEAGQVVRFDLTVVPEGWRLTRRQRSQVWQDQTLQQIVGDLLAPIASISSRFDPDVGAFLSRGNHGGTYPYRVQYRESDWAAVSRELAREGLCYYWVEDDEAGAKHGLRFACDTAGCAEDPTSAQLDGIEVQRDHSQIGRDVIQSLGRRTHLQSTTTTIMGWDPATKTVRAGSRPARSAPGALRFEEFWDEGDRSFSSAAAAMHYAGLRRDARDCQADVMLGFTTVRTLRAGTIMRVRGRHDLLGWDSRQAEGGRLLLTALDHAGVNNLPAVFDQALVDLTGSAGPDLLDRLRFEGMEQAVLDQAEEMGYGNAFHAIDARVCWRPELPAKRSLLEFDSATVVGPHGEMAPAGADEIYRNARGEVRVRFDWQQGDRADDRLSCWVPVGQAAALADGGAQFIPRIGQRVLVSFADGNPEMPFVRGAVYTGRGEGGIDPTPGGQAAATAGNGDVFKQADDARPGGQGNMIAAGNSPAWHGQAADPHRNAAALSGVRSKEFGGDGFTQAAFDDTDGQERVQFGTTQHATWLQMGHLVHQQDNYRGSLYGTGWTLVTAASGAIRAARGLLLSTYASASTDPAADNAAGQALALQMLQLAQTFDGAASAHQTVRLGNALAAGKEAPMLQALKTILDGMVSAGDFDSALADAGSNCTDAGAKGKVPHTIEPVLGVMARAGQVTAAGQDLLLSAGSALHVASGGDTSRAIGGFARLHTGQAIGVLAGAVQPGAAAAGTGITMIAGRGDVQVQAQGGPMQIAAKGLIDVASAHSSVNWAAAKKITLQTAGGARMELSQAGYNASCPGKITVYAASKSFAGAGGDSYPLPVLPHAEIPDPPLKLGLRLLDIPGRQGVAPQGETWRIVVLDEEAAEPMAGGAVNPRVFNADHWLETLGQGTVPASGELNLSEQQQKQVFAAASRMPKRVWVVFGLSAMPLEAMQWTGGPRQPNPKQILDSLNFAHDGPSIDAPQQDFLAEIAKADAGSKALQQRKPETMA